MLLSVHLSWNEENTVFRWSRTTIGIALMLWLNCKDKVCRLLYSEVTVAYMDTAILPWVVFGSRRTNWTVWIVSELQFHSDSDTKSNIKQNSLRLLAHAREQVSISAPFSKFVCTSFSVFWMQEITFNRIHNMKYAGFKGTAPFCAETFWRRLFGAVELQHQKVLKTRVFDAG